jgi:secretion/DNA translocation related TadE-like protein
VALGDRRGDGSAPERGAGTVLVLGVVAATLSLAAVMAVIGQAFVARHRAAAAADLAALSGATAAANGDGGRACGRAAAVAAANGARLVSCAETPDGVVSVVAAVARPPILISVVAVTARARAGPAGRV